MELIDRFGDVPWVDTVLDENSPEAYGPRISRDIVAKNVMTNLKWAYEHIGDFNDGENTINKDCILLLFHDSVFAKVHGESIMVLKEGMTILKSVLLRMRFL